MDNYTNTHLIGEVRSVKFIKHTIKKQKKNVF